MVASKLKGKKEGLQSGCWAISKLIKNNKKRTSSFGKSGPRQPQGSWKLEEVGLLSRKQFMPLMYSVSQLLVSISK